MYRKSVVLLSLIGICLTAAAAGAAPVIVKINFQTAAAQVPTGYLVDSGLVFADRGNGYSYGWNRDISADARERANKHPDQRYDTFIHLQKAADAIWEIAVPNGEYDLVVFCGDAENTNQTNTLDLENVIATDPNGQTGFFDKFTVTVIVTDARLTVKPAPGSANAKICFIDITQVLPPIQAIEPVPADGATDVPRDTALAWTAAPSMKGHHVYLGTEFQDVNDATVTSASGVLVSENQMDTTYEPANVLAYGQTYFWRIDEVNSVDSKIHKGLVWSFTVEPYVYAVDAVTATASGTMQGFGGPQTTVDGSGLDADDLHSTSDKEMWLSAVPSWIQYEFGQACKLQEMWVWNSNGTVESLIGLGAKGVTVEYSLDGETWTELADVPEFTRAPGMPGYAHDTTVDFGGAMAKFVKLTINSNWSGMATSGLSEVRFFYVPVQAYEPAPAVDATGVELDAALSWRPGREAASHAVYFSADANAVAEGTVAAGAAVDHSFSPAGMEYDRTYFWRVDEVNEAMTPSAYEGSVWTFTTRQYATVDDFESYTDHEDDGTRIYETWVDGYGTTTNGALVGYLDSLNGTFGETIIVHGDKQSMPVTYGNTGTFSFSEATQTFSPARNWTANGVKSLSLYIQGAADNSGGQLYVKINGTKVPYTGDASDITKPVWLPWNIDLSTVGGNLSKVTSLTIGVEGAGATGVVYVDDIRLYPKTPQYIVPVQPDTANLRALYAFEGNANDTSGNKLNGTIKDGQLVSSGRPNGGSAVQVSKLGYVDLGNPASLDFSTGNWTVAAWYKTAMIGTGDANKGTICGKGGDTAGGHRYALIMSETAEGVVTLITDDDVTKYVVDSKSKTNDDEWHLVVGQREGTALRIFIDGQLEGTGTATETYTLAGTTQHNAYIGAITDHTNNVLYKLFNGLIDDVRIYDRALSEGEILGLTGRTAPMAKPF